MTCYTTVSVPVWIVLHPDLSPGAVQTWLALADIEQREGVIRIGLDDLGMLLSVTGRTMMKRLDELRAVGALTHHRRAKAVSEYTLHREPIR